MGMKPPLNEAPLKIKGACNNPSPRDPRAAVRGSATRAQNSPEKPVKGSIQRKQFGK